MAFLTAKISLNRYRSELSRSSHTDFGEIGINLQKALDLVFKNGYGEGCTCEHGQILVLLDSLLSESCDGWVEPVF